MDMWRLPVLTLRWSLILATGISFSLGVLLPCAFSTFNYFYNHLLPTPSISLPFHQLVYDHYGFGSHIVFDSTVAPQLKELDSGLAYDFTLKFVPHCEAYNEYKYMRSMYKLSLMDESAYQIGSQKEVTGIREWPLGDDMDSYHSQMNTIVVNCKEEKHTIRELFAPLFQSFIPQLLSEWEYRSSWRYIDIITNLELSLAEPWVIVLQFKSTRLIVDPRESSLEISVSWRGIRHYLFHYRLLSYLIGVSILWGVGTFAMLSTLAVLIANQKEPNAVEIKTVPKVVIHGTRDRGYAGRVGNIGFSVSVEEADG